MEILNNCHNHLNRSRCQSDTGLLEKNLLLPNGSQTHFLGHCGMFYLLPFASPKGPASLKWTPDSLPESVCRSGDRPVISLSPYLCVSGQKATGYGNECSSAEKDKQLNLLAQIWLSPRLPIWRNHRLNSTQKFPADWGTLKYDLGSHSKQTSKLKVSFIDDIHLLWRV